ncbi:MAG: hypothetical protein JWP34_4834 [Massilia sp.]|nr:hypothetical protein [Massilia sp.]
MEYTSTKPSCLSELQQIVRSLVALTPLRRTIVVDHCPQGGDSLVSVFVGPPTQPMPIHKLANKVPVKTHHDYNTII